jgi:hypothetical protein
MSYVQNAMAVMFGCVEQLLTQEPGLFFLTLLVGLVLAGVSWLVCTHYSRLWNRTFRITWLHRVLCACAAALTLVFCVLFVSLQYTQDVANRAINVWDAEVLNPSWQEQAFIKIYWAIRRSNLEDFRNYPPPDPSRASLVPLSRIESRLIFVRIPADEAARMFVQQNPFLSYVLSVPPSLPESTVVRDVNAFFAVNPHSNYPIDRSVGLTANLLKNRLELQTPRVVEATRFILTLGFLLAQAVPFTVIGIAAYRDLKIST